MTASENPLILTLALDANSSEFFNQLRQQHFPPERNYLNAHLTLFHQLPRAEENQIMATLREVSAQYGPLSLSVAEVRLLGKGVAYYIKSQVLQQLHRQLQKRWKPYLTAQDQQKLWPHVTIQNKVTPEAAKSLHEQLSSDFEPFVATGTGFRLWEYQGGPWQSLQEYAFKRHTSAQET